MNTQKKDNSKVIVSRFQFSRMCQYNLYRCMHTIVLYASHNILLHLLHLLLLLTAASAAGSNTTGDPVLTDGVVPAE